MLEAAVPEFAQRGFERASTESIARRAGISQPYVFRLFGSKRELFRAAVSRCLTETLVALEHAARGKRGSEALEAVATAYAELLRDRSQLVGRLQASGACDDPEIRAIIRDGYGAIVSFLARASGAAPHGLAAFLARGFLLEFMTAIDLDGHPEPWSELLFGRSLRYEAQPDGHRKSLRR